MMSRGKEKRRERRKYEGKIKCRKKGLKNKYILRENKYKQGKIYKKCVRKNG